MPFFQEAQRFNVHGGTFQDMKDQHNHTEDHSFRITGDGNDTHYAPDHSVTDNRLYDYRTATTPEHVLPPPANSHAYAESSRFTSPQTYSTPSAVMQLQEEVHLLQLQLQSVRLQQEIALSTAKLQSEDLGNQAPSISDIPRPQYPGYPPQHQYTQPQYLYTPPQTTILPQQFNPAPGPGVHSSQAQSFPNTNPLFQGHLPSQLIPPHVPPSRPTTVEPPSSVASTSSGEDIRPPPLAAQLPTTVLQGSVAAPGTIAHSHLIPIGPPSSGNPQLPPTVVVAPVVTLPSGAIPTSIMQVNQEAGVQEHVPAVVEKKKKKRLRFSKLFQKVGLKKKS